MTSPGLTAPSLTADQALDEFRAAGALLTGHFILSSGLHSPVFLQKMFVFQDPARTERLCRALAEKAREAFGAQDIITTGLPSRETLAALAEHPGTIVGAACLIDRSNGEADIGVQRVALATLDIPAYAPDAVPPELAALPP